jgi:hypothetical protein
VIGAMIAKGLLRKADADLRRGKPVRRETGDGHGTTNLADLCSGASWPMERPVRVGNSGAAG